MFFARYQFRTQVFARGGRLCTIYDKCGNSCCNGGYGVVDGVEYDACPSAYILYFKGKNDETLPLAI